MTENEIKERVKVRINFRQSLTELCKACDSDVHYLFIQWDENDTKYMTAHNSVTVMYNNGYSKIINTECNSFRATAKAVLNEI